MSPNWCLDDDGERWRLRCGDIVATCSPTGCSSRWLWRVDAPGGFGTWGSGMVGTLDKAKASCEVELGKLLNKIQEGLGVIWDADGKDGK